MSKTKIGIIGCGNISGIYLKNSYRFRNLELAAVADLDPERAKAKVEEIKTKAAEWGIKPEALKLPAATSVKELLANPEISIVVNLTIPRAHCDVALQAIEAGKHTYCEKPLGVNREEGKKVLAAAKAKGVRVGSAPDTFFGAGIQTCRKLIDDGWIGTPIGATGFMCCHGHESWHPDPEFYYDIGGGPMFDMGPYYLTALVNLLGPVKRVSGSARASFKERVITSQKKFGKVVPVMTPTHIASVLDFANGAIGSLIMSFDMWNHNLPILEIYGTEGSLSVPDPNSFGGEVKVRRMGAKEWSVVPHPFIYSENARGIGVADMASAVQKNRPHRASGELANHVLDIMCASLETSEQGQRIELGSTCDRPAPLPLGLRDGDID